MLTFRAATPDDADPILALVASAYRGDESRAGWTTEADLLEGPRIDAALLSEDLANESGVILTGWDDRILVACCNVVKRSETTGYFGMFAVSPTLQGAGLGKQVLAEAERMARDDWGLAELEMTVLEPRTELIAFYERRGYRWTGGYVPFPYGDPRFGEPQRDDLRMVVLRKPLAS